MPNIIASAPVPPTNRLIDADTADIAAIRKADNAGRFPVNQPYTGRAAVPAAPSAGVLELGRRAEHLMNSTDMTPAQIAAELGVSVGEAFDAMTDLICWEEGATRLVRTPDQIRPETDWFGRPVDVQCAVDWCRGDCVLGGPDELGHYRTIVNAQVASGSVRSERRRLLVQLQQFQSPEIPGGVEDASVYLSTGDTDEYGVALDLDEAETLALAVLAAVRAARTSRASR